MTLCRIPRTRSARAGLPLRRAAVLALVLASLAAACAPSAGGDAAGASGAGAEASAPTDSLARARQDSINRAQPGYIVDSILPIEEEIRRFTAAVGGTRVAALSGGATSVDALVARFASAVAARDTIALQRMALSAREFIDIVYPESPYTRPPYRQAPGLLWSQIQLPSRSGLRRLLERHGGHPLRIASVRCPGAPERQGNNRLHVSCTVQFATDTGALRDGRLFGTLIERDGRFKFVSFTNMY